ncbi:hypothetical protein GCM10009083_20440 [Halopseudomonas pertucinogena]|uniref:DUF7884 domain-containing protein n=1 Tax=Halopseudomonas pertucinogena TaxID=86175 RepID=A0ABQ2CRQ1_9GAMM|nr:hypothetical protein GCM10009083_20440 [Halopseudomonas pertucinogena]
MFAKFSETLGGLQLPLRVVVKGGPTLDLAAEPRVTLQINDLELLQEMQHPTLDKLGEAYIDQRLEIQGNIMDVIEVADRLSKGLIGDQPSPPVERTEHDRKMDAEAISYHYDLSNEFYELWLDPQMVYSCGYFRSPEDSLAAAQTQKLDHLCRKLRLKPGERLLDVGCGWGGTGPACSEVLRRPCAWHHPEQGAARVGTGAHRGGGADRSGHPGAA